MSGSPRPFDPRPSSWSVPARRAGGVAVRTAPPLLLILLATLLGACAVVGLPNVQEAKRIIEAAQPAAGGDDLVRDAFRDLGRAAGLDPASLRLAVVDTPFVNVSAYGGRHFLVARPLWTSGDPCLTWGLVAHEVAHAALRHGERLEFAAAETSTIRAIARAVSEGVGDGTTGPGWPIDFSHTEAEEAAADTQALTLLGRVGRPPWLLSYAIGVVETIHGGGRTDSWLATHPVTTRRRQGLPAPDDAEVDRLCGTAAVRAEGLARIRAGMDAWNHRRAEAIQKLRQDRDRR